MKVRDLRIFLNIRETCNKYVLIHAPLRVKYELLQINYIHWSVISLS